MNILVLGGSYFLGKSFVNMAREEHQITVFNRGSRPLNLPQVCEMRGDRHDAEVLSSLRDRHFDAIVDFCAYEKKDIASVFENLKGCFDQYVFISTCDVYERGRNEMLDENAPFERREFGGEAGDYIRGKVLLEEELADCAQEDHVAYTSIRPAFIYGPENYAPREGIYFHWVSQAGQILHPVDATGEFQMVYVEDVANAILRVIGNPSAYNQAYNLAPLPMETYETFSGALAQSFPLPFEKVPVTCAQVQEKNIPLPFPLIREESNWYDGRKVLKLIGSYTTLADGLKKTILQMN
ncbi:MAG: NAD-dependent epimerase/dehydratase family protein [Lachnospiraceae bacterium]